MSRLLRGLRDDKGYVTYTHYAFGSSAAQSHALKRTLTVLTGTSSTDDTTLAVVECSCDWLMLAFCVGMSHDEMGQLKKRELDAHIERTSA